MSIIVHGGAYAISDEDVDNKLKGCQLAARAGHNVLVSNGTALDAVEIAVRELENDPVFNAGHGSIMNCLGDVEMDAMIMEGATLSIGSVACVQTVSNPVTLARKVMENTEHTMLAGKGADLFAREIGIPQVSKEDLISAYSRQRWNDYNKYKRVVDKVFNSGHDTVGAVARDRHGNIACATSTGGICHKRVGRVGDSPMIGCGGYSDNELGGVSCTGHGESITRVMLANRVLQLSTNPSLTAAQSVSEALKYMWNKVAGRGGLIMITPTGEIAKGFTTERMAWASIDNIGVLETGMNEPKINVK